MGWTWRYSQYSMLHKTAFRMTGAISSCCLISACSNPTCSADYWRRVNILLFTPQRAAGTNSTGKHADWTSDKANLHSLKPLKTKISGGTFISDATDWRKSIALYKVPRLRSLVLRAKATRKRKRVWDIGGTILTGKTEYRVLVGGYWQGKLNIEYWWSDTDRENWI